ncbi:MAG: xanthine dehydrogenase family protein molybdopterin-binding subunit [Mongoliibacter sp.]|uniref:xanthine dehydrogenase family protein molybdopterin-binding subunit n=1 Tax=Mongoliibacter sp. TaxID=2022438 RepID=UPI0012EF5722|nr:molybdopterin cofactor-binding domain-containing protein [Mongoliibacter sp.]TVP44061.1 MAG: xanthine dehydrogenase family protein molybdopterin-binding subunit [Mongoliibacter sp.]
MRPTFPFFKPKEETDKSKIFKPSRRDFLKVSSLATGGFFLGITFQCSGPKGSDLIFAPNAYLNIDADNLITIVAHRSEMGTGIRTSLPMIIADELGADWSKVKIIQAEGDEDKYGDQNTDGSYSVRMFYEPMRRAGATARHMLLLAASQKWKVAMDDCYTENGMVHHTESEKSISFGDLVSEVQKMEIPRSEDVILKPFSDYKLIGKDIPIYDAKDIATGKAIFGADVDLDKMKIAVIKRCPVVGGKAISVNDTAALAISGVEKTVKIEGAGLPAGLDKPLEGIAVIATNTWAAIKGRDALEVDWDLGENKEYDSAAQLQEMLKSTEEKGKVRRARGDFEEAMNSASKTIERTYELPYYAHATIEPPAAIANYSNGKCEVWAPSQHPQWARGAVATALGIEVEDVTMNVTLLGGGFGRKSKPDFIVEAAILSKEMNGPVRVQWTREDDLHHDFYHALSAQRIRASLDGSRKLVGWNHHTVFPAIGATSNPAEIHPSDGELGLGCVDFPYDVPNIRIETHESKAHTRIGWLRSVSNIHHSFAINCMMDEVAEARSIDPINNALEMLGEDRNLSFKEELDGDFSNYGESIEEYPWETGRMKAVIQRVAKEAGWGQRLGGNKAMGFACQKSFLTYVACIVIAEKGDDGKIKVSDVHYAVDCGIGVNTDRIRSQFEGGAQFAHGLATSSAITFKNGKVEQNNFDTYLITRMPQAPKKYHIHIVESMEKPTGVGEPPVPPYAPALANAVYKLTGKRQYKLPFSI